MPHHAELSENTPLSVEEALTFFRVALGEDQCTGMLLAVSGGPDSMALLGLAAASRAYLPPLAVVTIDHGLRPEAKLEAEAVAEFARELHLPHCTVKWENPPAGKVSQEAARKARYALMISHGHALGASHLATAHTLDDQAETVLMRMSSGSGVGGLGGMRMNMQRGSLIHLRPFLQVPKSRILATCAKYNWYFAQDPTNKDHTYARTRMRALIPMLAEEGLTAERLGTLAERAQRVEDAVDLIAKKNIQAALLSQSEDGQAIRLRASNFASEPFEISLRMLRYAMLTIATPEEKENHIPLNKLEALLQSLCAAIKGGHVFRRTLAWAVIAYGGGKIEVRRAPPRRIR